MTEKKCAEQGLPFIEELMVCDTSNATRQAINAQKTQHAIIHYLKGHKDHISMSPLICGVDVRLRFTPVTSPRLQNANCPSPWLNRAHTAGVERKPLRCCVLTTS
ncbi:hypothetical protein E2C01_097246 [Portunus trituberculatus]|uniref:Uncharacterized protein n=1 Tax=Portunus trituberculatus TaxID=210409 RepID=A0A5B7K455_PORTR|nr:hypothetical protein [Portunus trituberculatus]